METINDAALCELLEQLPALCQELAGAVLATRDGLVLASIGDFQGDTPAACAASLFVHLQEDLLPLLAPGSDAAPREALVFGDDALWYLSHLAGGHLLLLRSRPTPHVGALRLAGQTTATRLNRWLRGA